MRRNILLLILVLVISFATASYFGSGYDKFSPQYGSVFWGLDKSDAVTFVGFPFAYIFFVIILFKLFGLENKNKWIGWLLVLPFLFFASGDLKHIYLPIILALIALGLAMLLRKIFEISKHTEPSPQ